MLATLAKEPMLATEAELPMLAMESTEPCQAMDKNESVDQRDQREVLGDVGGAPGLPAADLVRRVTRWSTDGAQAPRPGARRLSGGRW